MTRVHDREDRCLWAVRVVVLALVLGTGAAGAWSWPSGPAAADFAEERKAMVWDQVQQRDVTDPRVVEAMGTVPRHRFVPEASLSAAYGDFPLPIGYGQTISQPYIVAFMCEKARIQPTDSVLEVGTGSGYHAAIISRLARQVRSIEIVPELAARARETLAELGYANVETRQGDGYFGWPEAAPFDVIIVTAAADHIPPPLLEQLADGGRMVIPVGSPFVVQKLVLIEREGERLSHRDLLPVRFVPLTGPGTGER